MTGHAIENGWCRTHGRSAQSCVLELEQQLGDADLLLDHEELRSQAFRERRPPPDETLAIMNARERRRERRRDARDRVTRYV